jgi:hypothetical protein
VENIYIKKKLAIIKTFKLHYCYIIVVFRRLVNTNSSQIFSILQKHHCLRISWPCFHLDCSKQIKSEQKEGEISPIIKHHQASSLSRDNSLFCFLRAPFVCCASNFSLHLPVAAAFYILFLCCLGRFIICTKDIKTRIEKRGTNTPSRRRVQEVNFLYQTGRTKTFFLQDKSNMGALRACGMFAETLSAAALGASKSVCLIWSQPSGPLCDKGRNIVKCIKLQSA